MASIYDKASLVLIPSGTKTSKVYSQKPTNGDGDFTFSRSTAATRVNASGNIEKETNNYILHSNNFNNWSKNIVVTSGQAGYDGSNDAYKLVSNASSGGHRIFQSQSQSGVLTYSVYAKPAGYNFMFLYVNGKSAYFDLSSGAVGTTSGLIDSDISSAGNGYYRCSITFSGITTTNVELYIANTGSSYVFTGDGTSGIFIQDIQFEQGLVARDYIETTTTAIYGGITDNVPRLDYTDSSCPALLLEPQRTNLITSSEALSIGTSGSTTEQNTADTTSPEGYYNATKILGSTSYLAKGVSSAFSGNNTTSVFLKHGNDSEIGVYMYDGAYYRVSFDITNGTIVGTFGGATGTITDYGNGWYRCTIYKSTPANVVEVGVDGLTGYVYTYGWQHEYNASYATSYIPTYGSAVTRNAETSYVTGATNLIGQTEGTIFAEFEIPQDFTSTEDHRFSISDGGIGNWIFVAINNIENVRMFVRTGNTSHIDVTDFNLITHGTTNKLALAYKSGSTSCYLNGIEILSSSSTFPAPTSPLSQLNLSGDSSAPTASPQVFGLNIKQRTQFPTRLSNEELATLTTI